MEKLYTEEQVLRAIMNGYLRGIERHPDYLPIEQSILKDLTPIELPTDEEIKKKAIEYYTTDINSNYDVNAFTWACNWMRDKIKGGNK